jgi:6-pyruvoyltetrahydropterin/6-carboxytetrahydropterin synthase
MYKLKLKHHFDAAHQLILDYKSPCVKLHGHRWEVEVTIKTNYLDKNGMIVDFKLLKEIINHLDHCIINDKVEFNPTAENIAKYIYEQIQRVLNSEHTVNETEVTIWESPEASITYSI